MYITIILILISLNCSTAQVATCTDDANNNVDCTNPQYFKPPNVVSSSIMKSEGNPTWAASAQTIDQNAVHAIFRTMASFVAEHMDIKVLAYSDNPPNLLPRNEKSKAKVDSTGTDAAAWFVHTVPKFLAHLGGYSWPAAETAKGHMFLCLSFNEAHLNLVAKAIRYQEPFIYANSLSPELLNQHVELSNLIMGAQIRVTPFLEHAKFATKAAANIQAFGKHTKSYSDMYAKVLKNKLAANIRIWAPSDTRSKSICKGQYQLRKIASPMQLAGSLVSREADSAKWALVEQKNTVCLTTNDYTVGEKKIPGAAVCLENAGVYNAFMGSSWAQGVATCKADNNADLNWYFVYKPPNSQGRPAWGASAETIEKDNGHSVVQTMVHFTGNNANIKVLAYSDDPPNLPPRNEKSKAKGVLLIDNTPPNVLQTKIMQSQGRPVWGPSAQTIERDNGHSVVQTMIHFIGDNANIKVLAYSDDPPNLPPRNVKSKAKGVILIDNTRTNAATWFIHTVPNFLAYLGGYSWPQTETAKGHIFLCLSINEESLNVVAKAIRYQEPHIYVNNLPPALLTQHNELSNLVTGVEIYVTPFLEHAKFATKNNQIGANIQVFGKLTKSFADMYAKILRKKLSANIRIWAPSDARSKSICNGQYHLRKIASPMQFDGVQVSREADSAKWALVEGRSTVCLTTNDYKMTEKQIPGAAVCLENADVYNAFSAAASNKYQKTMKRMYFVYKPPNQLNTKFMTSGPNPVWDNSATPIDNVQHSIGRTMANFVQNNPQIKVLAYSDDPPNIPARNQKRVLLIDMRMDDAATWFIHTAPNFLAYLGGYSWPQTETAKGHIFL
ncbi:Deoxyribonuclease-2-alpha, partial [Trichinella sp. T8]